MIQAMIQATIMCHLYSINTELFHPLRPSVKTQVSFNHLSYPSVLLTTKTLTCNQALHNTYC